MLSMSRNDELLFPKHALLARVHHVEHLRVIAYELLLAHLAIMIRIQRRETGRGAKCVGGATGPEGCNLFAICTHELIVVERSRVVSVHHREQFSLIGVP